MTATPLATHSNDDCRDPLVWFTPPIDLNDPCETLFLFPYAGIGASAFRGWSGLLEKNVRTAAVQFPGRESRLREEPLSSVSDAVDLLLPMIAAHADHAPYALFGHSLGALHAFELARSMMRHGLPGPNCLIVSAREGPQIIDPDPPLHKLPDDQFITELSSRYDGIPKEILAEPDLLQLLLPTLRGDMAASETYSYEPSDPLDCPLIALGGKKDMRISTSDLEAWQVMTTGKFEMHNFDGGHFFLQSEREGVVSVLKDALSRPTK